MKMNNSSPGAKILNAWTKLHRLPGGSWLFSRIFTWNVPYTGSIRANVIELRPGFSRVMLRDRKRVRNHLNSIHAVALVNLGEMTSGLALLTGLPARVRGIVTNLSTQYHKKARGTLIAECICDIPEISDDIEYKVVANIMDQEGDMVATTTACWRLGPIT